VEGNKHSNVMWGFSRPLRLGLDFFFSRPPFESPSCFFSHSAQPAPLKCLRENTTGAKRQNVTILNRRSAFGIISTQAKHIPLACFCVPLFFHYFLLKLEVGSFGMSNFLRKKKHSRLWVSATACMVNSAKWIFFVPRLSRLATLHFLDSLISRQDTRERKKKEFCVLVHQRRRSFGFRNHSRHDENDRLDDSPSPSVVSEPSCCLL
jgi:hypothetical protein